MAQSTKIIMMMLLLATSLGITGLGEMAVLNVHTENQKQQPVTAK